jgi:hypothetical protein
MRAETWRPMFASFSRKVCVVPSSCSEKKPAAFMSSSIREDFMGKKYLRKKRERHGEKVKEE